MKMFSFFQTRIVIDTFQQASSKNQNFPPEKNSSCTRLFATLAFVEYLYMSYFSACAYRIGGFAHENLQNFADGFLFNFLDIALETRQVVENLDKNLKN